MNNVLPALLLATVTLAQETGVLGRLGQRYGRREPAGLTTDQRITYWENRVKLAASDLSAVLSLASAFLQKTRETTDFSYVDRATALIDRVLTADPENYEALRLRIEVAMNHHRFPRVIEYAEELLLRNPSDSGLLGLLGDAFMEMGRYSEAERAYQRMLERGGNLFSYNRLAYYEFVMGRKTAALSWMSRAVEAGSRQPEHEAWCKTEFGDMLFKTGETELAYKMYRGSLEAVPNYHRANAALGHLEASRGNLPEAITYLQKAQAAVPLPEYAAALGALHRKAGKPAEANRQRKVVDGIAQLGRANGEKANRTLALIYADEGRNLAEALKLVEAEFEVRKDVYTHDAFGWVLFKTGRIPEAQKAVVKALAFNTPEPTFYYHAGAIALAAGEREKAQSLLERAISLNPNFDFRHAPEAKRMLQSLKR